jgi:hypothetical protein
MPEPEAPAADPSADPSDPSARQPWWQRHVELIVVILLGVVSVATAYTSFQSSLYGGASDDRISKSEAAGTEAESLYLEGNQQFQKDAQTIATLQQLQASIDAGDPYAQAQYDALYFIAVSGTDLEPAFQAAAEQDASDPGFWHDPQSDDAYQESLFGSYGDEKEKSDALRKEGDAIGDQGDQLGFYTALMAITLFLLGIAAVVKRPLMRWVLIAAGMAIFTVTAVLTAMIPFVWVGY